MTIIDPTPLPSRRFRPRRGTYLALLLCTIVLGLLWRLAPLHLPPFAFKYGGSLLWAMAVYWLLATLWVRHSWPLIGSTAAVTCTAVELFKLVYWPPLDQFRLTLPGTLLLGRYFSLGALLAYGLALCVAACLDALWIRATPSPHDASLLRGSP